MEHTEAEKPEPAEFVVAGRVTRPDNVPATGLVVRAYDRDLRKCEPVGKRAITIEDGSYEIRYSRSQFVRAEQKSNADLVVRVYRAGADGDDEPVLAESPTLFNAPAAAEINLELRSSAFERTEYERYNEAILSRLIGQADGGGNLPIVAVTDDDIDFLSRDSGIDPDHIRLLVDAAKVAGDVARDGHISVAVFYGWFRLGLPTDPRKLWKKSTDELMSKLLVAVAQRLIPAVSAKDQKLLRQAIDQLRLDQRLRDPSAGTPSGLGQLLGTLPSPPDPNQQRALAAALNDLQPDDPRLVQKIRAVPGFDGDAAAVARTVRLGKLTGGNIALTKALQTRLRDADEDDGTLQKLATIQPDEWIDLAYTHPPDGEGGTTPDDSGVNLATQIERQHPTAVLARQVKDGGALSQHPLLADVGTFLTNNPVFDIVSTNVNAIEDEMSLRGVADRVQLDRGLKALQRFNSLGASWNDTATLMDNDLYSPQQFLDAGPAQLNAMLDGQLPAERIAALHDQAEALHNATFAAMTSALSPLSGPNILPGGLIESSGNAPLPQDDGPDHFVGLSDLTSQLKSGEVAYDPGKYKSLGPIDKANVDRLKDRFKFDDVVAHQPTLQALFGSQDACACDDCSSVLSPAAYFVDLLQFVRKALPNEQLLKRLLQRRPDLQDIELTCSNTDTEVPAIDLVLEILENAVALPLDVNLPAGTTLDQQLRDQQPVGAVVRSALEKTVRHFAGEGRATLAGANGDGTSDWTVVDLHRRWTLNARPKESLLAEGSFKGTRQIDSSQVDIAGFIRALDKKTVPDDAEALFGRIFAPNQKSDYSNYQVTATPLTAGQAWRVAFRLALELVIDAERDELTLRFPHGKTWVNKHYNEKTITGLLKDLANNRPPELVRLLVTARFPDAGRMEIKPVESRRARVWSMLSEERAITLTYRPARLTITSLAYQSGDANADPIAEPENHNPEAYERLKSASFPWTLPLDLPVEEVRAFLERARSSRRELIDAMLPIDAGDDASFAAEVLGLSAAEATLISVASASPEVYDDWGIPETQNSIFDASIGKTLTGAPPLVLLKNVSVLLQQARVSFEELESLIETQFVTMGGEAPLNIVPRTTCKPSEMSLAELTTAHLDRLHRFIRLWRRIGWTIHEVDLAIQAFDGTLSATTLVGLAGLKRLKEQSGLPVAVLVGALDVLETQPWVDYLADGAPERLSLYESIFQREAVRKSADFAAFALRADRSDLQNTPTPGISTHAEYVGNCIGVAASIVTEWVTAGNALGIVDTLDLPNLSRVTAAANTCAVLNVEPAQLSNYLRLLGASPFRTAITVDERLDAFLDFIKRFRNIAKAGMDAETIRYLLQHYDAPGSDVTLSALQVTQLAATARDAVRSIPSVPEPQSAEAVAAAKAAREDAVIAALASNLGATRELVDELLRNRLQNPADANKSGLDALLVAEFITADVSHMPTAPIPPGVNVDPALKAKVDAADKAAADLIVRLYKSVYVCNGLKFTRENLTLLSRSAAVNDGFTALDFNSLPVAANAQTADVTGFEQLAALTRLRAVAPGGGDLLHRYIVPPDSAAWSPATARLALATGLGLSEQEVKAAADQIHVTTDKQYRDPQALIQLVGLLVVLKKPGATVALAIKLTSASPDETAALAARELLRSKFGDSQWHDLIKPIEDKLRERQRNALVDYLVARDRLRDANDLYETYLIDVQTASCMDSTRLLQATASVQLFVQRVLLRQEPGASLSQDKRDLWDWMQNYRVWEANRKVFLFPENWLLPELRDDKTDIFRQMESALSEGEPTPDSMRSGLLGYLEELGDVAQIRVVSMYQDRRVTGLDAQGNELVKRTLYVTGRTPNTPYRYFWRSCAEFGSSEMSWSGWEALDLDNANDFIMPFVFAGELHVTWPILRKTKEQKTEDHDTAKLLWEVQLAWTRRTNKGWVKRKIGSAQLESIERLSNKDEASSFAFRFSKQELPVPGGDSLKREIVTIDCYAASELVPTPSFVPDPALEDSDPVGTDYDKNHGYGYQWNVSCVIQGTLYKYFDRTQQEGGRYYETCIGTVTVIGATRQSNIFDKESLPDYIYYVDSDGAFRFSFPTYHSGQNGSEGLNNGGSFKLRIEISGAPTFEKTVTLQHEVPGHDTEYSLDWTWTINHGVQDGSLASRFDQARTVKLSRVGHFLFETGKDLGAELTNDGAAFQSDLDVFTADNNSLPEPMQTPTTAVRAAQLSGSSDLDVWSITEGDNAFAYAQIDYPSWKHWADGQPFAAIYRISAATSAVTVFQTENQRHLHLDPDANTFERQNVYANYNWELFLHAPLAIADFLASQQRFDDARHWLHAIFDPTTDEILGGVPQYWRFLPFSNDSQPDGIAKLLTWLADPGSGDPAVENALSFQIEQWRQNPFMPHLIARLRPSAYQWYGFFAYLDVLIKWGDQLFRRDTREAINEATLLYVLAAKLLGPRPRTIEAQASLPPQTYRSLSIDSLDDFSNAWIQYADLAGVRKLLASAQAYQGTKTQQKNSGLKQVGGKNTQTAGIQLLSSFSLAFCIPQNEKIAEYYDLIEKRLFDIRHCRNIDGVFRVLPLYDPPIDPLLLIRARAAGLDIATVIAEMYAPLPNYRFLFTLQKAVELCSEVKSLGGALLAALEKQDAEELGLLRSGHEIAMLKLVRDVRKKQLDEADANIVALQQSQATATERFNQFQKLLGKTSITRGQDGLPVVEQSSSLTVSTDPIGAASGLGLTRMEVGQLRFSAIAHQYTQIAGAVQVVAGVISLIPNIFAGTPFAGQTSGGTNFGIAANAVAKSIEMIAAEANYLAGQASTFGGYERRQDEWVYQSRLALAELKQLDKQILAAQIRKNIAQNELDNHDQQISNANAVDDFLRSKFSNQQLFKWMSSQIAEVYFRTYQLALDQARRAERTFQRELGLDPGAALYVQSDNWDSLKRGLLAGERLHNDLKRMESAYLERNMREFEITRHVSLLQLDPLALIDLREEGICTFKITEALFDLDCPGHFMRRIKTVSLSIPCVAGGYASVSATVRLTSNDIRVKSTGDTYKSGPNDSRFTSSTSPTMAMVTSNSQQDSGMFEPNLRDDRYLPFEGAGVISTWEIELPREFRQFDYDTIADVILHIRYTSRYGGPELRDAAVEYLGKQIGNAEAAGMVRLFSVRHEFPTAWAKFIATKIDGANIKTAELSLQLRPEHYPFWAQGRLNGVKEASIIAKVAKGTDDIEIDENPNGTGMTDHLTRAANADAASPLTCALASLAPKSPVTDAKPLTLYFKDNAIEDLWIAIAWKGPAA